MWKDTDLKQASYNDIGFDFIDIEDGLKKTIAKYDYPYADGSELEDMGLEARTVKMKAVFMGENYIKLSDFLSALKEQGAKKVVHPILGSFDAIPDSISIKHNERAYYAEVDINFIEHKEISVVVQSYSADDRDATISESKTDTLTGTQDILYNQLNKDGLLAEILDGKALDPAKLGDVGFISTITGYTTNIKGLLKKIDSFVGKIKGYINKAMAPFKLITSTVKYLTNLPGSILSSIADAIETVASSYQSLLNGPGKFTASLNFRLLEIEKALKDFEGSKPLRAAWNITKAAALIAAVSLELKMDEEMEKAGGQASRLSLKYGGGEIERTHIMTITEIDEMVKIARESVNTAITSVRDAFGEKGYEIERSLKYQALIIQEMADVIRIRREKIITYEIPSDMPLHLLSFNLYGDISKSERLMRINKIKNPNFLKTGEVIRIYA